MGKPKRMDRVGRALDICAFLHRNYLVNGQWATVGEYARFAGISKSPHLIGLFHEMLDQGLITVQQEPYRATVMYTFAVNYQHVEKSYPQVKKELIERVGVWQEVLL